jgi:NADH:ubiquinone oxidoreductase subunit F (NADH-binding)
LQQHQIDSKSIDDYLAIGGYAALGKALCQMSGEEVLEEVKKSNLRGKRRRRFSGGQEMGRLPQRPGANQVCDRQRR